MEEIVQKKRTMGQAKKLMDTIFVYCLIALPLIEFFTIYVYINVDSFFLAFQRNGEFAGLANFKMLWDEIRAPGSTLLIAIRNTFIYFGAGLILFVWSIILSYFFYKKILAYKFFRFVLYMPAIISPVVFVALFKNLTSVNGAIGLMIKSFNPDFKMPNLLARSETATWTMVVYVLWMGWTKNMLYLGGSLARIPLEAYRPPKLTAGNQISAHTLTAAISTKKSRTYIASAASTRCLRLSVSAVLIVSCVSLIGHIVERRTVFRIVRVHIDSTRKTTKRTVDPSS